MNETENSPTPTEPKKLVRPREGRMLGGVCAGLGRHFEIDATIARIAMLLITCGTGVGIFVYPICWIVIPEEDA